MTLSIVSGATSTLTDLGRDEAWLQGWLKEQPSRLGLGQLSADAPSEGQPSDAGSAFTASLEGRCYSVDVQLGELDASHGFGVLDAWARNKARQPEKDHVAVLVTESCGDRYRTTLETLSSHLPLVVIELAVWRGENEAIVVPHVALASKGVDLASTPASAAATTMSRLEASSPKDATTATKAGAATQKAATDSTTVPAAAADAKAGASNSQDEPGAEAGPGADKDATGVTDPWGLPRKEPAAAATSASTSNGSRLLTKFNT